MIGLARGPIEAIRAAANRHAPRAAITRADFRAAALSRRAGQVPAVLCGLAALLALSAAPASAALQPATPPSFGSPGSAGGQLAGPTAVATNNTSHDVYVADTGNSRISQFTQDGSFIRAFGWGVVASGPDNVPTNEQQSLTVNATGGTFTLFFNGEASAEIPFNASAAELQAALEAIPSLGAGNATVSGSAGGPFSVQFSGALADTDVGELGADPTNLSGPEPGATVATTTQGAAAYEICEPAAGDACKAGSPGAGPGQLAAPVGIAVDNSSGPSQGTVYVADSNRILSFGPAGAFLGANDGSSAPQGPLTGLAAIATDGSGDLWSVDSATGKVDRFDPTGAYVPGSQFSDGYSSTTAIAVNPAATRLYLMHDEAGTTDVWDPANPGAGALQVDDGGTPYTAFACPICNRGLSLAVDPSSGDLYVEDFGFTSELGLIGTVVRYDSSAKLLEVVGGKGAIAVAETAPESFTPAPQGLAFDPDASLPPLAAPLYVLERPGSDVRIFASPPLIPPTIDATSAASISATSADLRAQVNPHLYATSYHFEYVDDAQYLIDGFASALRAPTSAEIDLGSAGTDQQAFVHIQGLTPETTYHYRVIADNGNGGPTAGSSRAFETTIAIPDLTLPDSRAYEMVSPFEKSGGEPAVPDTISSGGIAQATPGGEAITYVAQIPFGETQGAPLLQQYIARRGPGAWSNDNTTAPLRNGSYPIVGSGTPYKAFSTDLSASLLDGPGIPAEPPVPGTDAPLGGYRNYYIRDNATAAFEALITTKNATINRLPGEFNPRVSGATPDLDHVVFTVLDALTSDAGPFNPDPFAENLYVSSRSGGHLQAINILPGDTLATPGNVGLARNAPGWDHPISDDGSRVVWKDRTSGFLYLRDTANYTTVQLDAAAPGAPGPGGDGQFQYASSDGSRVFFTDPHRLTIDARGSGNSCFGNNCDLFEYDVATEQLTDITPDSSPSDPNGADVRGNILGASEDGSYVYFAANGVLAPAAEPGNCVFGGEEATRQCNLYLLHEGEPTRFIATLSEADGTGSEAVRGDSGDWDENPSTRVTPDGRHLAFMSSRSLTGYDNAGQSEVYIYDAEADRLSCASCNPSGATPLGSSSISSGTRPELSGFSPQHQPRVLSDDGTRLFFDSNDALLSQDTNRRQDVYEWEQQGAGGCKRSGGCIYLLSGGTGVKDSTFIDASTSGDHAFFLTPAPLLPQDIDTALDLYDANSGGGFPPPPPPPPACQGDACQTPVQAPNHPTPATSTSLGSGNLKGPLRKHHRHRKHRQHSHRKSHARHPSTTRRLGR